MSNHTRVRFGRIIGMLVALAALCALPAVAMAQDTVSSGNTQTGTINQSASAGAGGNAGNQGAIVQQNAGRDANASVNQSQNFSTGGAAGVTSRGVGVSSRGVSGVTSRGGGVVTTNRGGGVVTTNRGGGVVTTNRGGVGGVVLARTGFEAWILALVGGAALAGGIGLLALQRRGRLTA
jgi:hypothetical protein